MNTPEVLFLLLTAAVVGVLCILAARYLWWGLRLRVPYVPTGARVARRAVELTQLQSGQVLYDLGAGTGTALFAAAKKGIRGEGYELQELCVWYARALARITGVQHLVHMHRANLFTAPVEHADAVFLYMLPAFLQRFETDIWPRLQPGTRVVSHGFALPKKQPVHTEKVGRATLYVYTK